MKIPFKSEIKESFQFLWIVFKNYNINLYRFFVHGSFEGRKITDGGEISYKFLSQVVVLFLTLFLTYLLWSDLGISFSSLFYSHFVTLVFLYTTNGILDSLGYTDSRFPGVVNVRSISLLLFAAVCSVGSAYYAGYLMDLSYFYKLFYYIIDFIYFYYYIFFAFSLVRACIISDSEYLYDKIRNWHFETKIHSLFLQYLGLGFIFVLVCNFYSNINNFGSNFSEWVLNYSNLNDMFISFLIPFAILVLSLCIVISVRFLDKPKYEWIQLGIHSFFWILSGLIIFNETITINWISFLIIILSYLFICYIVKKIISDYLRTYKYLSGVLYLILLLVFLSMFFY